jgi:glutaminyl-peptide cyclotransferase
LISLPYFWQAGTKGPDVKHIFNIGIATVCFALLFAACDKSEPVDTQTFSFRDQNRETPQFNADSAFRNVEMQLAFGPRVPGTEAHRQTRDFFVQTLRNHAGRRNVFTQDFTRVIYGDTLRMSNVIAAFNTGAADRIFLCAHWDTRPRADRDPDFSRRDEPIPGADDGGSGVAVLLELARIMAENPPPIGVDLILFDGEDYGMEGDLQYYFLGAREWSENPPVPGYRPRFGILLDMVGARDARFPKEQYSLNYARSLVDEVWKVARQLGYADRFPDTRGAAIADDHLVINEQLGIPTINVINHDARPGSDIFAGHWHTHSDDIGIISEETLGMVGQLVTEIIYNRIK